MIRARRIVMTWRRWGEKGRLEVGDRRHANSIDNQTFQQVSFVTDDVITVTHFKLEIKHKWVTSSAYVIISTLKQSIRVTRKSSCLASGSTNTLTSSASISKHATFIMTSLRLLFGDDVNARALRTAWRRAEMTAKSSSRSSTWTPPSFASTNTDTDVVTSSLIMTSLSGGVTVAEPWRLSLSMVSSDPQWWRRGLRLRWLSKLPPLRWSSQICKEWWWRHRVECVTS